MKIHSKASDLWDNSIGKCPHIWFIAKHNIWWNKWNCVKIPLMHCIGWVWARARRDVCCWADRDFIFSQNMCAALPRPQEKSNFAPLPQKKCALHTYIVNAVRGEKNEATSGANLHIFLRFLFYMARTRLPTDLLQILNIYMESYALN